MSQPYMKVTSDFTTQINDIVRGFKKDAVLVGVPQAESPRTDGEEGPELNNATILALNNFGSPAQNIPARPVMEIGIENAQDEIAEQFAQGAKLALTKGLGGLERYYERAGSIAANSVKKAINSQEGLEPPALSTLAHRRADGFKGDKALIVTGQLRNSITYVVNKGGR